MTSFRKPAALLGLTAAVFAVSTAQADETSTNLDASIKPSSATVQLKNQSLVKQVTH